MFKEVYNYSLGIKHKPSFSYWLAKRCHCFVANEFLDFIFLCLTHFDFPFLKRLLKRIILYLISLDGWWTDFKKALRKFQNRSIKVEQITKQILYIIPFIHIHQIFPVCWASYWSLMNKSEEKIDWLFALK